MHSAARELTGNVGKQNTRRTRRLNARRMMALAAASSAAVGILTGSARATIDTWAGSAGSTDWLTAGNWNYSSGNGPVVTGDSLVFTSSNASSSTTLTDALTNSSFNIGDITFNAGALAYTMSGNAFALTGNITNNSNSLEIINNAISEASTETFTTSSNGGITLGALSAATGASPQPAAEF